MAHSCEAIVLRRIRYSESSLIIAAFSVEFGRIDAIAKGCRRERSPLRGHLELFSREEMFVYDRPRAGLDIVADSFVLEEFMALRRIPAAFAVASLAAEILLAGCMVRDPHSQAYAMLLEGLRSLERGEPAEPLACTMMLGLLGTLGFEPRLDLCAACGDSLPEGKGLTLSGLRGGLVCPSCSGGSGRVLAPPALASLRYLSRQTPDRATRLSLGRENWPALLSALQRYTEDVLGRPLRSMPVFLRLLAGRRRKEPVAGGT